MRLIIAATIMFALLMGVSFAQVPSGLSIKDARTQAYKSSPTILAARARLEGATARRRGAGALGSPILSIAKGLGNNTGGLDEDILLTQTVEIGDKRRFRVQAASGEEKSAIQDLKQAELETSASVTQAYYEAQLSDSELGLAKENQDNAKVFATAAETQFKAGDVAKSNLLRSQIELTRAEQAVIAAQTERDNKFAALANAIGLTSSNNLKLSDALQYNPTTHRVDEWKTAAIKRRADLAASRYTQESRNAAARIARSAGQPDLFVEGRHSSLDPSNGGTSVRFGITLPLLDFGRMKADTRSAQASAKEQGALILGLQRQVDLEVETNFRNVMQARKSVESFQGGRLDRSKQLLEMAQIGYQKGANSFLELLDAQQINRSEQIDYLRAIAAYNIASNALERAAGGPLP
ncbi:MAG: TolC family protein [Chthonomonadales bacterium]